ncbi:MAG: metallophosphoesterase [Candidatus Omnitrophica bacterium]|nr:metallophosphoesterase [Candidatus Omnitrophota bacterium]
MNILIIADIHNDIENIPILIDKISLFNFDIIIANGDFTDITLPKGFSRIDITELILEELKSLKKQIFVVPGNQDKELINFFEKEDISLHGIGKVIENIGFYGFGGAQTPFNTPLEPSENEIEKGLNESYKKIKNCKIKIQVTHMPPARTKLDLIASGAHVGSETIRKFIEKNQPDVAISAHIHEAKGLDELEKTKLINPGRFPEGYCGFITIEKEKISTKIINLI